jgi:hypothetical protein
LELLLTKTYRKSKSCDEMSCGDLVPSGTGNSENVEVRDSSVIGAGSGLFAIGRIDKGTRIGYFGGAMMCSVCVKKSKITRRKHDYSTVECGIHVNAEGVDVRWYLHRTRVNTRDGICWYINSTTKRRKRSPYLCNCEIVFEGFGEFNHPVVGVVAKCVIEAGQELFLDYM